MENETFIYKVMTELLGKDMTAVTYCVAYLFAFFGMFLRWYWMYQNKGKMDPTTPSKFVWSYWMRDNLLPKLFTTMATLILLFITLRFPQELLGKAFSYFYAFGVGIGFDYVSSILKKMMTLKSA